MFRAAPQAAQGAIALGIAASAAIRERMRKLHAALLFCLLPSSASFPESSTEPVVATAIPLDPSTPERRRFGRLRYVGGWHLTSRQRNFGGYSALHGDGRHFLTIADTGQYLLFTMERGQIVRTRFGDLPGFPGPTGNKRDRDAESMTVGPEGDVWVGFEYRNAVMRYSGDLSTVLSTGWPPAMANWARNSGAEAMVRLEGGRFVIFAEGKMIAPGVKAALMFPGDPTQSRNRPFQFGYRPPKGYVPSDAALLPDGRIIVLNRRFGLLDGFSAALTIVDPAAIAPGAKVAGEALGEFAPPLNIDNMEGITATQEGGRTMLWLISDDNQVPIERTLLLKFQLD